MMIWCLSFLIFVLFKEIQSLNCSREHEYLDYDGSCKQCEMCPPGFEPTQYHCGYGVKDSFYSCKPCNEGSFSTATDYNLCITCSPCKKWNAIISSECTSISNSICGQCHSGYYRPEKANGAEDSECFHCSDSSDPRCQDDNWMLITIVLSVICIIAFFIAIVFGCLLWKSRRNKERNSSQATSKTSQVHRSVVSCDKSTRKTTCKLLEDSSSNSLPSKADPLLIDLDIESYSNRPTAQFQQPGCYSQLPTTQFTSQQSLGGRTMNAASGFESVDILLRDLDVFDTSSMNNPTSSLPLLPV